MRDCIFERPGVCIFVCLHVFVDGGVYSRRISLENKHAGEKMDETQVTKRPN